jgi:hypothetical protein
MMILAALLVWWAVRVVPSALGLASAAVNVGGSVRAGGSNVFIDCTPSPSSVTLTGPKGNGQPAATGTVRVNCTSRMNMPLTVDLSGSLTPTRTVPPGLAWSANPISLTAGTPVTNFSDLTVSAVKNTSTGTYTFTYATTVTASNGMDYTESHTLTITIN